MRFGQSEKKLEQESTSFFIREKAKNAWFSFCIINNGPKSYQAQPARGKVPLSNSQVSHLLIKNNLIFTKYFLITQITHLSRCVFIE